MTIPGSLEHPELIDNAADEFIRYVSPVKHFMRTCQEPFTIRDVTFQPGEHLYLSYASANRDEAVFPDALRLDVTRENAASHLAFGFGRQFCLGVRRPGPDGDPRPLRRAAAAPRARRARQRTDVDLARAGLIRP